MVGILWRTQRLQVVIILVELVVSAFVKRYFKELIITSYMTFFLMETFYKNLCLLEMYMYYSSFFVWDTTVVY
jgi:hypothetical protein